RAGDLAVEDVDAFVLPAVDVRWGIAARTHERFNQGILAVGVLAGRQEAVHVADEGDSAALLGGSDNWLHSIGFLPILRAESSRTSSPRTSQYSIGAAGRTPRPPARWLSVKRTDAVAFPWVGPASEGNGCVKGLGWGDG